MFCAMFRNIRDCTSPKSPFIKEILCKRVPGRGGFSEKGCGVDGGFIYLWKDRFSLSRTLWKHVVAHVLY